MSNKQKSNYSNYQLRNVAGQYYLLDMEQAGVPYKRPLELNTIGAEIWTMMVEGCTNEEIMSRLHLEYEVEINDIREDVLQFQNGLATYGVIIGE